MRILYQFPLSPFCEKVRWMLDYKELPYVAKNLMVGLHRPFAQYYTQQHQLPILNDQGKWLADSVNIAQYLDKYYVEYPLMRVEWQSEILYLDDLSQQLGKYIRYCILYHLLHDEQFALFKVLLGEKGIFAKYSIISEKIMIHALQKYLAQEQMSIHYSEQKMYDLIHQFDHLLDRKSYLCGCRFSLADIALCSMLAPLLNLKHTPWHLEYAQSHNSSLQMYQNVIKNTALFDYVQSIYDTHRHARVDWRGV